jgi:hypothetical protein
VPLDVECACAGHLDDVHAPQSLGAEKLDEGAAATEPLPRHKRQILYAAHADAAVARHPLDLHETVVRQRLALEFAETCVLAGFGFVPVDLIGCVVHRIIFALR